MKPLLQLNLRDDSEQAENANLPKPMDSTPPSAEASKRLDQIANRVAHKGAAHYGRSGSGIFSR